MARSGHGVLRVCTHEVDFAPFIFSFGHPDLEPYKSVDKFLGFEIINGNLNWDEDTMIFHIEDLYYNRLMNNR